MGVNFYQVEAAFFRKGQRAGNIQDAQVFGCLPYYPDFFSSDPLVYPKLPAYNPYPRGKKALSVDGVGKCSILCSSLQSWASKRRARPSSTL